MTIVAVTLAPNVTLTLVEEDGAWRFGSWSRHPWAELPSPDADDLARRFTGVEDAAAHFRSLLAHDGN
jgi:hypothetical protein